MKLLSLFRAVPSVPKSGRSDIPICTGIFFYISVAEDISKPVPGRMKALSPQSCFVLLELRKMSGMDIKKTSPLGRFKISLED